MRPTDNLPTDERVLAPARSRTHRLCIGMAAAVWILGIAFGARQLQSFESTPGTIGSTPTEWPAGSQIARDPNRMTLVMLVHPQCSCTQASLAELAQVMERAHGRLTAWVLFAQPRDAPHPAAWIEAERLPDTQIGIDPTGAEAARFGALTSGYLVLYDRSGRLRFSGGITAARGHAGENMGRTELLAALDDTTAAAQRHSVFGCSLKEDAVPQVLSDRRGPQPTGGG
jgi:hypothetical protein